MSEIEFEDQLKVIASGLKYPPTPDLAGAVMPRLRTSTRPRFNSKVLVWSLTIILVLFSSLMLIPTVRAAIIDFIQIGVVRIFPQRVTPTVEMIRTATPESIATVTATPSAQTPSDLLPFLDKIAGETTLAAAQKTVPYGLQLPTYPPDLGEPDRVFLQNVDGAMVILVWLDHQHPDKVVMSLHVIPSGSWVIRKMGPRIIQETRVNGQRAIWAEGPYPLILNGSREIEIRRLVDGHVLIWEAGDITYRLETDGSMDEAIKIAESLKSIR